MANSFEFIQQKSNIENAMNQAQGRSGLAPVAFDEMVDVYADGKIDKTIFSADGIATFETPYAEPLKQIVATFGPIQAGSGDPSPENIRPISGRTVAAVSDTGVNVWDEQWEVGQYNVTNGEKVANNSTIRSKDFIPVNPSTVYRYTQVDGGWLLFYDENKTYLQGQQKNVYGGTTANALFTTPSEAHYMTFYSASTYGTTYNHDISINYPATDTEYHAYEGKEISVTFPSSAGTVYGGTLTINPDRTGQLVVEMKYVEYDGSNDEGWQLFTPANRAYIAVSDIVDDVSDYDTGNIISNIYPASSYNRTGFNRVTMRNGIAQINVFDYSKILADTTVAEWRTMLSENPMQVAYQLKNPITYNLTESEISGILSTVPGLNNVWTDLNGGLSITYKDENPLFIADPLNVGIMTLK